MKIPVEWLKEYVSTDKSPAEIASTFTVLGLMLDKPITQYSNANYKTAVLDLEHRMDRSDWLSVLGCARDFAAYENQEFKYPDIHAEPLSKPSSDQLVDIKVECPDLVSRFNTVTIKNITVTDSPDWLKNRLAAYGITPINNIVDITNYVMVETGQPMHAQDLAKFQKREIVIRRARAGETITTLLGETLELSEDYFVLTQDNKPIVLGGIVGGKETGVDVSTTEIVLDAGNYNQVNIRKSSRKTKIQNETVLRYDKFLHPKLTEFALKRAIKLILDAAGGEVYENVDWYENPLEEKIMDLRFSRLARLSGMEIPTADVKRIVTSLDYEILQENDNVLTLKVPYFRTDVEVEDDIVSDVLRVNDYNNIPTTFINTAPPKEITPEIYKFEEELRNVCERAGLHEHITDPLVSPNDSAKNQIVLENAMSKEKSALRTEMYSALKYVTQSYFKHKQQQALLFELGKIYEKSGNDESFESYKEHRHLQVVVLVKDISPKENAKVTKKILATLLRDIGIHNYTVDDVKGQNIISVNGEAAGEIRYDAFNLNTNILLKYIGQPNRILSEYLNIKSEDISVIMPKLQKLGPLVTLLKQANPDILNVTCTIEENDAIFGSENKNVLFRVSYTGENNGSVRTAAVTALQNQKFTIRE